MQALHVDGTRKLATSASQKIKHWVQLSSVGVYGPINSGTITETALLNPIGPYEVTKAESDKIVLEAASNGAFTCCVLRPSNVFGNEMTNQSLFGLISIIDRGLFFYIGKPGASANYIHVDNVVRALTLCGTESKAKGKIFNLSDQIKMEEFVDLISKELSVKAPILRLPKRLAIAAAQTLGLLPGVPLSVSRVNALSNFSSYPINKIQSELNYEHKISMEDGLRDLVKCYKEKKLN
jgi:nucleoside-diphosphate-sugar epimerase